MGLETPVPPVKTQFVPKHDVLKECATMGAALGAALAGKCSE